MLKKNQPVKFTRPVSTMKTVFEAIDRGLSYRNDIIEATKLHIGQVRSALSNLVYIGVIVISTDAAGRRMYAAPGKLTGVAPCLLGVRSIFDVR